MKILPLTIALAALVTATCAQDDPGNRTAEIKRAPGVANPGFDGRALFLKNCAHCHGADGSGGEGPDLHQLDESDEWLANRIRNGKKGQMPAFSGKLQREQITALVSYLRGLK